MNSTLRIAAKRSGVAGPVTSEYGARSAQTATRNAMLAEMVVLSTESVPSFIELITQLQEELQPESFVENMFVEVMAVAHWRRMRLWIIEKNQATADFRTLADKSRFFGILKRDQARLRRQYQRNFEAFNAHRAWRIREAGAGQKM